MVVGIQPNWRQILGAILTIAVLWFVFHSYSSVYKSAIVTNAVNEAVKKVEPPKVQVDVYYETLCPDSRHFVVSQLLPAWRKLKSIMEVNWKPYGKAQHSPSDTDEIGFKFQCQHGPEECLGNLIHACAAHLVQDQNNLHEYVNCMIDNAREAKAGGQKCAGQLNIDWDPILACTEDEEGGRLLAMAGEESNSLRPKMTFVPTVIVDGSQDNQSLMLKNLDQVICKAYKGPKPDVCVQ